MHGRMISVERVSCVCLSDLIRGIKFHPVVLMYEGRLINKLENTVIPFFKYEKSEIYIL